MYMSECSREFSDVRARAHLSERVHVCVCVLAQTRTRAGMRSVGNLTDERRAFGLSLAHSKLKLDSRRAGEKGDFMKTSIYISGTNGIFKLFIFNI